LEELFFNFQVDIMNIIFYAHGEKWRKGNEDKKMTYLDRFFHLTERNTSVRTEIIAGLTTFLSCVSIVVLNPSILSAAGMDALFWATAISCAIACVWIGLWGNFPFALGPAMGLNSFFAFSVVLGLGVSWQNALACVFTSGCIFMLLSVFRVQQKIVDAVPDCVKKSIGAGVGLFIAFSGFQSAGIVAKSDSTLVTIGQLGTPGTILALIGLVVTLILVIRGVKGGILIGIVLVTIAGIFVKDPATGMAYTVLPSSFIALDNPVEALAPTFGKLTFRGMFDGDFSHIANMAFCIISFLFVDLFDEQGKTPGAGKALFISAGAAAIGAIFGTSTVTIYGAESGAGIAAGGRTGLTACTIGALFLLTLIFSPLFLMIPSIATAPALIIVGIFMISQLSSLDLSDLTVAVPAFMAVATMPFTFNIAYGVLFSMLGYTLCMVAAGRKKELSPTMIVLTGVFIAYFILDCIF
jgi:AGZA family xanthine/uracil permease-like MFS transporter